MKALIDNQHVLINALLFQVVWFVAVLAGDYWALLPVTLMLVHISMIRKQLPLSVLPLLVLAVIGVIFDSLLNYMGVYQFPTSYLGLPFLGLPVWLACLWLGFCLTLPLSLAWLIKKPLLFVLGCSILGPVSYLAGRRLDALSFSDANIWFLVIQWGLFSIITLILLFPKLGVSSGSPLFFKEKPTC